MKRFPNVMSPLRAGNHLLKNRVVVGPSTIHSSTNGELYPTEEAMRFFEDRAKSGAGVVTVAGASIMPAEDDGNHAAWDLYQPVHTNRLAELVERIHLHGAKATMELIGIFPGGWTVSDGCSIMGGPPGRGEAPLEVLADFKFHYIEAAKILKSLGFDGILLHFGHSIPIAQFLSPLTNRRTDQYGGTTENRCRYPLEIIQGIRQAVGQDMLIEVRISGSEFESGGITVDEGIAIGLAFQPHINLLQVSAGMHNSKWMTTTHPCGFLPPAPNVYLAEAFKKSGQFTVPIGTIGAIGSLSTAEAIIAQGKADYVVMARSLVADPELITKTLSNRSEDIIPCIRCMRCHDSTVYGRHFQCSVNPTVGMEGVLDRLAPAASVRKVAVVGGGPAGMKAALTAWTRGHTVTLFEGRDKLGGALIFADYVPFKYPLKEYKDYLACQVAKSGITLKLNTTATSDVLADFDSVILALGATPLIPPISGITHAQAATQVYGKEETLGDCVVVIGGGQVGCETALHLARLGKQVTLIEMQDCLAPDASTTHREEILHALNDAKTLTILTSARCTAVSAQYLTYEAEGNTATLPCTSVILAAGMTPRLDDALALMTAHGNAIPVGDCVKARTAEWATKEGYYAALKL